MTDLEYIEHIIKLNSIRWKIDGLKSKTSLDRDVHDFAAEVQEKFGFLPKEVTHDLENDFYLFAATPKTTAMVLDGHAVFKLPNGLADVDKLEYFRRGNKSLKGSIDSAILKLQNLKSTEWTRNKTPQMYAICQFVLDISIDLATLEREIDDVKSKKQIEDWDKNLLQGLNRFKCQYLLEGFRSDEGKSLKERARVRRALFENVLDRLCGWPKYGSAPSEKQNYLDSCKNWAQTHPLIGPVTTLIIFAMWALASCSNLATVLGFFQTFQKPKVEESIKNKTPKLQHSTTNISAPSPTIPLAKNDVIKSSRITPTPQHPKLEAEKNQR